jgi:hypothetical protein
VSLSLRVAPASQSAGVVVSRMVVNQSVDGHAEPFQVGLPVSQELDSRRAKKTAINFPLQDKWGGVFDCANGRSLAKFEAFPEIHQFQ